MRLCLNKFSKAVKPALGLLIFLMPCLVPASSLADPPAEGGKIREVVTITSDRMETFGDGSQVVFSGAVTAVKGNLTVDSRILRVYYQRAAGQRGVSLGREVEKIVAEGDVVIRDETAVMTGDKAILHYEEQTIVMTGDRASLKDGENMVEGGRITWFLDEGRGIVDDLKGGRVTATIQPDTEKQGE